MIKTDTRNIDQLERTLGRLARRAIPYAEREALNSTAFDARRDIQSQIGDKLVERNPFTRRSIRVDKATLQSGRSVVGSVAPYFERVEFGGVISATGKNGVAIPTGYSAGQEGQRPRTRLPRKPNQMKSITLGRGTRRRKPKNNKQATLFKVQDAVTTGRRVVFLSLGKRKGLFRVLGGRKRFKRGWPVGARIKMLYDMTEPSVTVPRQAIFSDMTRRAPAMLRQNYARALRYQARRAGLL